MVKVGKLWGSARFASLSPHSKLLYLYLVSHPSISTLGILELGRERAMLDVGIREEDDYFQNLKDLEDGGWLIWAERSNDFDAFIIKEHYLSLSKSKLNIRKAIDEGKNSLYKNTLREVYEPSDFQPSLGFIPPTPEEATEYALSLGYVVNGQTFVDYYSKNDWYNKNNKKVRSWKATLERVWCREENKLELVDGAPEGFEYFHIMSDNGERISPEGWRNGRPTHSNYLHAELLIEEFNECITNKQDST